MAELTPVHLMRWIEANQASFTPPVANKEVFPESEFIYQIVRGPNARNDFHLDPGDEIFLQLQGDITVRCRERDGRMRDVIVREGESMLVRAGTPHCPIRPAHTWGLVIERSADPTSSTRWPGSARAAAPSSTARRSPAPTSSASSRPSSSASTPARHCGRAGPASTCSPCPTAPGRRYAGSRSAPA